MNYTITLDITPKTRKYIPWYKLYGRSLNFVKIKGLKKLSDSKSMVTRYLNKRSDEIYKKTKAKNIYVNYAVLLGGPRIIDSKTVKHEFFEYKLK